MKIKNVSPFGDLDLPLIGRVVAKGEVFEVSDADGSVLIEQAAHWREQKSPIKTAPRVAPKKEGESK